MRIFDGQRVPIKSWCANPEAGALAQARNLANLPFVFKQVCLMPDVHEGYGMPIGGVVAAEGVVIPNAVGVDIGCGMCAVKTDYPAERLSQHHLKSLLGLIRERIPVGFAHHYEDQSWDGFQFAPDVPVIWRELSSARRQIGTLGGGNHFIELQRDESGLLWIMIHSGSRNFGLKIATEYNQKAKQLCRAKYPKDFHPEYDLAFLPLDSAEAREYLEAMKFALEFARANRQMMLDRICDILEQDLSCRFLEHINIHHNYAAEETHFGRCVVIHRKGATSAMENQMGIIPGSQGTQSYIVRGKGNPESFMSCSHGAGRIMSRKKAQRELDLQAEIKKMSDRGIVHSIRSRKDLDEASSAYKNIELVMDEQKDLVEAVVKLQPLAVVKG